MLNYFNRYIFFKCVLTITVIIVLIPIVTLLLQSIYFIEFPFDSNFFFEFLNIILSKNFLIYSKSIYTNIFEFIIIELGYEDPYYNSCPNPHYPYYNSYPESHYIGCDEDLNTLFIELNYYLSKIIIVPFFYLNFYLNIFDSNFFFSFLFVYIIYNIVNLNIYVQKALNLYYFLLFLLFTFILFGFNSFVGFLILVELTTVTFIVVLVFNFGNFFNYYSTYKNYYSYVFIFLIFMLDYNYMYVFNLNTTYFSYYSLYLTSISNDFVSMYLYIFFDTSLFIILLSAFFLLITAALIFTIKLLFFRKSISIRNNLFNLTAFFDNFNTEFYSKTYFWETTAVPTINKFQ